ncbi:choice-of-anchor K domain-containing protein, partial [Shewanella sp. 10N.286.54.B9]|uniref:choice-of-anchor K domain-containing protein n=1 Tax=Shewanella sp. 10N.286.54.B9 TaxID=3229719 RepID=UPI00354D1CF2
DTADVTLNVENIDDPVTLGAPATLTVHESALATGSGGGQFKDAGSLTVTANDGLARIEIGNTSITLAMLLAASTTPINIAGDNGTLTITDYSNGILSYTYTLDARQDHDPAGNGNDVINDNFDITAYDNDGDSASITLQTNIVDDLAEAKDDTDSVEVLVDSFLVGGVEAVWTSSTGGADVGTFDGFNGIDPDDSNNYGGGSDNDSGHDQIRWGTTDGKQSGYGFIDDDATLNGEIQLNQDITLGTFTHYNYTVDGGTAITAATMTITFTVTDVHGVATEVTLEIPFSHNETPNSDDAEASKDIIDIGTPQVTFTYEGNLYTVQVVGFRETDQPNGEVVTQIRTAEDQSTSYDVVVRIVEGSNYELPSTTGNVLTNDITGADTDITVVEVESDSGSLDVGGASSTTIVGLYGSLTINSDGSYTYQVTASANLIPENAVEEFDYTIEDADGDQSTATLTINVNTVDGDLSPVNQPTVTQDDRLTVVEDSPQSTGNVLTDAVTGDSDPDDTLTIAGFSINGAGYSAGTTIIPLAEGSFSLDTDGTYTFTPTENWSGTLPTITYTTNTGATADLVIEVTAKADAPLLVQKGFQSLAAMNFEDVELNGSSWSGGIEINAVEGANTIGVWNTANNDGFVEVGREGTYLAGDSGNQVMEIEGDDGDKTLYTDIECEAGRFYQVGFDIAARLNNADTSGMTISLAQVDAQGNVIEGTEQLLYTFDPEDSNWLLNQEITLPVDTSGTYRLIFESQNDDSVGAILDNLSFKAVDNQGYENDFVKLSEIEASLVDSSETLNISLAGIPNGSELKGLLLNGSAIQVTVNGTVNLDGWDLSTLQVQVANSGTYDLTVTATSTEANNGDVATSTVPFELIILDDPDAINGAPGPDGVAPLNVEFEAFEQLSALKAPNARIASNESEDDNVQFATSESDSMIAGLGGDTFVWAEDAIAGTDSTDHISNLNIEEDKLDLSDILQGDDIDEISQYINFTDDNGSTSINIDTDQNGSFDQHIVLDGVDLISQFGSNSEEIISGLLGDNGEGPLIVSNSQGDTLIIDSNEQSPNDLDNNGVLNSL